MVAYKLSSTALLLGSSFASPIVRRAANQIFTITVSSNTTCGYNINGSGSYRGNSWFNITAPSNCTGETPANNITDTYRFYQGHGSEAEGWPSMDAWASFDDLWQANLGLMNNSCTNLGTPPDNTPDETIEIRASIDSIAELTNVDRRFILATMLQESKGCVRVATTFGGVVNPGLLQSHNGIHSCNTASGLEYPCPVDEIYGMMSDGVEGTASGDGLVQLLDSTAAGEEGAQRYYQTARMYDSGSIDASGDLGAGGATHCYVSDIANRLTGWVYAASTCTLDG